MKAALSLPENPNGTPVAPAPWADIKICLRLVLANYAIGNEGRSIVCPFASGVTRTGRWHLSIYIQALFRPGSASKSPSPYRLTLPATSADPPPRPLVELGPMSFRVVPSRSRQRICRLSLAKTAGLSGANPPLRFSRNRTNFTCAGDSYSWPFSLHS